jgi:hypothetical protein
VEEVKRAVFLMKHNKMSGSDDFPTEFYQNFWKIIKVDLLKLFGVVHAGQPEFFRLKFSEIILLPK